MRCECYICGWNWYDGSRKRCWPRTDSGIQVHDQCAVAPAIQSRFVTRKLCRQRLQKPLSWNDVSWSDRGLPSSFYFSALLSNQQEKTVFVRFIYHLWRLVQQMLRELAPPNAQIALAVVICNILTYLRTDQNNLFGFAASFYPQPDCVVEAPAACPSHFLSALSMLSTIT